MAYLDLDNNLPACHKNNYHVMESEFLNLRFNTDIDGI